MQDNLIKFGEFSCVLKVKASLGECPRWDSLAGVLWWVDILGAELHRFDPRTSEDLVIPMPEHIGCFSQSDDGGFIAALRSGIWLLDAQGSPTRMLCSNPENTRTSRFNDGRCDAAGRFWAGTIDEPKAGGKAGLYRYDGNGLQSIDGGFLTSNGLAFSPDNRWLYHADTPRFTVYRRPFDVTTGAVGPREPWLMLHPTELDRGRPDGAAVDVEGYYWSALYEGGRIIRVAPDGTIVETYPLPAQCPTMCAFGGTDLRTLYVTTARHGRPGDELRALPESGGLFAMRVSVPGLPEPLYSSRRIAAGAIEPSQGDKA